MGRLQGQRFFVDHAVSYEVRTPAGCGKPMANYMAARIIHDRLSVSVVSELDNPWAAWLAQIG